VAKHQSILNMQERAKNNPAASFSVDKTTTTEWQQVVDCSIWTTVWFFSGKAGQGLLQTVA